MVGPKGDTGPQGEPGPQGPQGPPGEAAESSPQWEPDGSADCYVADYHPPQFPSTNFVLRTEYSCICTSFLNGRCSAQLDPSLSLSQAGVIPHGRWRRYNEFGQPTLDSPKSLGQNHGSQLRWADNGASTALLTVRCYEFGQALWKVEAPKANADELTAAVDEPCEIAPCPVSYPAIPEQFQ